jgi:hypothetical protein
MVLVDIQGPNAVESLELDESLGWTSARGQRSPRSKFEIQLWMM